MKKILFVFMLLLVVGCSSSTKNIDSKDIRGYFLQIKEDWDGDVTDLTNNPYAYLEITDDKLKFYSISFNENEGYTIAEKYYKLENNIIYYDYYELKGNDWKANMDENYGGEFHVSFDENNNLILMEYNNKKDKEDGYKEDTYRKIEVKDWPIEE